MIDFLEHRHISQADRLVLLPQNWFGDEPKEEPRCYRADSPEAREMWKMVDDAAASAPEWVKDRLSVLRGGAANYEICN